MPTTRTVLPALALISLALAGCGSASGAAANASNSDAGRQKARLDFAACMRQHGVNVPDPGAGGPGPGGPGEPDRRGALDRNTPAFQTAFTSCRHFLGAAFGSISPAQRAQFRQQVVRFTACMRSHGVNVPDPTFADGPGGGPGGPGGPPVRRGGPFGGIDRNTPAFRAAAQACQSQLPQPPGGGRGGPLLRRG